MTYIQTRVCIYVHTDWPYLHTYVLVRMCAQLLLKTLGQALYNEFSERFRQLKFCEQSLF